MPSPSAVRCRRSLGRSLVTRTRATSPARYNNEIAQVVNTSNLTDLTVVTEIPHPVVSVTYVATHAGHFGRATSTTPRTIQPPKPRTRRHGQMAPAVSSCESFAATEQHPEILMVDLLPTLSLPQAPR